MVEKLSEVLKSTVRETLIKREEDRKNNVQTKLEEFKKSEACRKLTALLTQAAERTQMRESVLLINLGIDARSNLEISVVVDMLKLWAEEEGLSTEYKKDFNGPLMVFSW